MTDESYKGYRGEALSTLKNFDAMVWSDVEVKTATGTYIGIILPRSESGDDKHVVVKLRSGYNVGILTDKITDIYIAGRKEAHQGLHVSVAEADFVCAEHWRKQ